ncbi:TPA: hypothetical protein ACQOIF_001691, partial [Streptococcus pyogenes]
KISKNSNIIIKNYFYNKKLLSNKMIGIPRSNCYNKVCADGASKSTFKSTFENDDLQSYVN